MTRLARARWLAPMLALAACTVEPPKNIGDPTTTSHVDDDWKPSALWLYATPGVAGGPAAECAYVRDVIAREQGCQGTFCRRPAELAGEWLDKCRKHEAARVGEVETVLPKMRRAAGAPATKCSREHERLMGKCEKPSCAEDAQRWATLCAESSKSLLAVIMLEHAVERTLDEGEHVQLDPRSCQSLRTRLAAGAACAAEEACKAAWTDAAAHRKLCLRDGALPETASAIQELAIAEGAGREEDPPGAAEPGALGPGAMPVPLADGQGAVLRACNKRPADLAGYLELRDGCTGGELRFARAFTSGDATEVKRGRVFTPLARPFGLLFPALVAAGERERDDQGAAAPLEKGLPAVVAASGDDALKLLVKLMDENATALTRSSAARTALGANDAALAPLFARLGEIKVKGAARIRDLANHRGLVARARTRPLADINLDGALELGAGTRAFAMEAESTLPVAMRAYRKALEPLEKADAAGPRPRSEDLALAGQVAHDQAAACADAQKRQRTAEEQLLACAFDASCGETRQNELIGAWQQAESDALAARRQLDVAASVRGESGTAFGAKSGCAPDR